MAKTKKYGVKVTEKEMADFFQLSERNIAFCKSLMSDYFIGQKNYSELVFFEIAKLYSNSFIFKDYLDKIAAKKKSDKEGLYILDQTEVINISSSIVALIESKDKLKTAGINLAIQ